MLYIGLIYQVEHTGPVRVLAYKLYTLVLLRLYPSRLGTKSSPFGSFIGLKKFIISIAIVEDLSIGLWQPVVVSSPNRLIVTVELLLKVVSVLVGNILEL
jgi:hypothetical protein